MSEFKSLKEHVYQYISKKINDGTIEPNKKIDEKMIINDLKISRTPVREALIQLASEGYLENIPRRGFFIKQADDNKVSEIYALLGVLDGFAATLAIDHLESRDLRDMEMLIYGMDRAIEDNEFRDYYELQVRFHDVYINKCGNSELIRMMVLLRRVFIRQSYETSDEANFKAVLQEANDGHRKILKLIKEGKKAELEVYLKEKHWDPRHALYDSLEK